MLSVSYILYLFVLVCGASFATAQTVDVSFDSPVVRVNAFTTATCSVSGAVTPIQSFRWEKDGNTIVANDRITITDESSRSTLEIEPAELDDDGEYSCSVSFMGGGLIADSAELQVATELILRADEEQEFSVRSTATLRCFADSSPAPMITWFRIVNGNAVVLDQQRSSDPDFGTYAIPDVAESDAGMYRCRARSPLDDEDVDIELIVLVPPEIITSTSTRQVMSETTLIVNCTATGMRPPTYHWLHNNLNIANIVAEDDRITANNITGSLVIRNIMFTDAGMYTCVATNTAGSDRQDHEVTVVGPPAIILNPNDPQRNVSVAEGTRVVLNCPFLSNPAPDFTRWLNPNNEIITESVGSRFQDFPNGTLIISVVRSQDSGSYTCEINNSFGKSAFTYNLVAIEIPGPPRFLRSKDYPDDERAVSLSWQHPASISLTSEVEKYLVELSFDERGFVKSGQSFLGNETSGELINLLPGENYQIRLRAYNLAGASEPSNIVEHTPPAKPPNLVFFNATAQEDGRSVLLEWELEFDGGSDITEFRVEVSQNGVTVLAFNLNVSLGVYEVRSLNPLTTYQFNAFLSNEAFSEAIIFTAIATTPLAFPSKSTTPTITSVTTHSITLSFTVKFGSRRITHFIVNITEIDSSNNEWSVPTQKVIATDDVRCVDSLIEVLDGSGKTIGFEVLLVITSSGHGLKARGRYVFEVAATSPLGNGRFSDPSDPVTLEDGRILYYIIAGIVVGVLFIVALILLVVLMKVCFNRYRKRKQRLTINTNGSFRAQLTQDPYTDKAESFILQSPPSGHGHQFSRHMVSPTNMDNHSNGINTPSIVEPMSSHKQDLASSPPYNRLHSYDNRAPRNIMTNGTGGGIDMPDDVTPMIQTGNFHSSTSNVPNGSFSPPVDHLSPRQHSQLHTSLSKLSQPSEGVNGVRGKQYSESVVSERQMSGSPPQQLLNVPTTVSKSTLVINSRNSFDSTLDSIPASYMTDV